MHLSTALRQLLAAGDTVVMPDAYDPLSARIIERMGFPAVQCSGFSMALSACSPEPSFGLKRNVAATKAICGAVKVPVMADGEDGFGDVSAIPATISAFIEAGVAGINLEDQVLGEPGPKRLIEMGAAVEKLQAARDAASEAGAADVIINGRTDALAADPEGGLEEAIVRGNAYLEAGADLVFVVGVSTAEQVEKLVAGLQGPLSIAAGMPNNMHLSLAELKRLGVRRVSLPSLAIFSAIKAIQRSLQSVVDTEGFEELGAGEALVSMQDVMGLLAP
ncbi:MAG: isocitrate lyase/PEP mutase family protein [Armatimonadia bacterium]